MKVRCKELAPLTSLRWQGALSSLPNGVVKLRAKTKEKCGPHRPLIDTGQLISEVFLVGGDQGKGNAWKCGSRHRCMAFTNCHHCYGSYEKGEEKGVSQKWTQVHRHTSGFSRASDTLRMHAAGNAPRCSQSGGLTGSLIERCTRAAYHWVCLAMHSASFQGQRQSRPYGGRSVQMIG